MKKVIFTKPGDELPESPTVVFLNDGSNIPEGMRQALPIELLQRPIVRAQIVETLRTNTKPPIEFHIVRILKNQD